METQGRKTRIYVILGATASGKSAVGLEAARRMGAEIISIDSMQVYRGMDIGTAKPGAAERALVPHHLLDVRSPEESFSAAEYLELADRAVAEIRARGRKPLFVGGTALYLKSLLAGIFDGPSADWEFRAKIREEAAREGVEAVHARLSGIDPEAGRRIHPNDLRRIERALEIYEKTGMRASSLRSQWARGEFRYDARIAGLEWPREELYARINERVDAMIARGWLEEARRIASSPGLGREASQALGYAELAAAARGAMELEAAVELTKTRTRQFAKRQMTWFRSFPGVCRVPAPDEGDQEARLAAMVDAVMECFGEETQ